MLSLPTVTLACVDCVDAVRAEVAMEKCLSVCHFADRKLLTSLPTDCQYAESVSPLHSIYEYSNFIIRELWKHIHTPYMLVVQHDGYILHPEAWTDEFLNYSYVGAPWDGERKGNTLVGNGGFSLRSTSLMKFVSELSNYVPVGHTPEDNYICSENKNAVYEAGFSIAPVEVAARFSHEDNRHFDVKTTFGFHRFYALEHIRNCGG